MRRRGAARFDQGDASERAERRGAMRINCSDGEWKKGRGRVGKLRVFTESVGVQKRPPSKLRLFNSFHGVIAGTKKTEKSILWGFIFKFNIKDEGFY